MNNDVIVIMSASCNGGWLSTYCKQLQDADIPVHVENVAGQAWLHRGGYIGEKIAGIRNLVKRFGQYDHIVFSDGFDVQFFGDKKTLLERIPETFILHAAEKNCYPDKGLAHLIPTHQGPWRFVNGGLNCGRPHVYLDWCDCIESKLDYNPDIIDQGFMNMLIARGDPIISIDNTTQLFFCLYGGYDELHFHKGLAYNMACQSNPLFIHANGKWDATAMLERHQKSLEI